MRITSFKGYARHLSRGAAIALVGGVAAGCSSDSMRFTDGFYTASVPPQATSAAGTQAYPGDIDRRSTGSVARGNANLIPGGRVAPSEGVGSVSVSGSSPRPPTSAYPVRPDGVYRAPEAYPGTAGANVYPAAPARQAVSAPSVERRTLVAPQQAAVDTMATGSTPAPKPAPVTSGGSDNAASRVRAPVPAVSASQGNSGNEQGWTASGGTRITLREGETIYNLSRRFGVPAREIMRVNNISDPRDVSAGQGIVIPTYVYSHKAPTSAPDANPQTQAAKSSRGTKYDVPADRVPVPGQAPARNVAVVRETPRPEAPRPNAVTAGKQNRATAATNSGGTGYTVASGDSLYAIARRHGVSVDALKTANGLESGTIRVGQKLTIPGPTGEPARTAAATQKVDPIITGGAGPSVKSGNDLPTYTPPKRKDEIIEQAEKVAAVAPETTGIGKLRWPVRGRIVSAFGANSGGKANDGIDIAVPAGTPVKAAENGVVIYAGSGLKEFGNTVLVRHDDGLVSVYGHNSTLLVSRGDKVRRGQEIAKAGNSGSASQPKLHFEIRKNSNPVNPVEYLE
ncbi:peptidoglycan DD-metalloendopeptidase family protein [Zhengella sp. ZM62]|uniref:peptidoglycan DD-metalloendopeptidase family protein n=1 Tax=Zhengella sedimenti TaxID=3390035 RepID=UPI003975F071